MGVAGGLKRGDRSSDDASWWHHMTAEKEIGESKMSPTFPFLTTGEKAAAFTEVENMVGGQRSRHFME